MTAKASIPISEPILIDAKAAAAALSISESQFRKMDTLGHVPEPVRLGTNCIRWRLSTLIHWVDLNCPSRDKFTEIMEEGTDV